jgi:hypothetical protein
VTGINLLNEDLIEMNAANEFAAAYRRAPQELLNFRHQGTNLLAAALIPLVRTIFR